MEPPDFTLYVPDSVELMTDDELHETIRFIDSLIKRLDAILEEDQ